MRIHFARGAMYPPEQAPAFAIFTSKGDAATGKLFPLGRSLAAQMGEGSRRKAVADLTWAAAAARYRASYVVGLAAAGTA